MTKYLEEEFSIEKLTAEFKNSNTEFYFATLDDNIIGYLKVNFGQSQTALKDDKALEIERIYVLKDFHGKNVGHLKIQRAINFYKKNGFEEFDKHIFKLGNDQQTDIMMKLKLMTTTNNK